MPRRTTGGLGLGLGLLGGVARGGEPGSRYVLKLLRLEHVDDWKQVELFEREVSTLAALEHPGIPRLIDRVIEDGRTAGIVQTYVEGHTIAQQIAEHGPLTAERFEQVLREGLEILAYLHEQVPPVLHRDVNVDAKVIAIGEPNHGSLQPRQIQAEIMLAAHVRTGLAMAEKPNAKTDAKAAPEQAKAAEPEAKAERAPEPEPTPEPEPKPDDFGAEFCATIIPCYQKLEFAGSFTADVTVDIEPDGSVSSVSFTGEAPKPVQTCITDAIEAITLEGYNGKPGRTRCKKSGQLMGGTQMIMSDREYEVRDAGDAPSKGESKGKTKGKTKPKKKSKKG